MIINILKLSLIKPECIFCNVIFVRFQNLPLFLQCTGIIFIGDEHIYNLRHSTQSCVFHKVFHPYIVFKFAKRSLIYHVFQNAVYLFLLITFRPKEFFKIQRIHFIISFITYTDRSNLIVIDAQK